MWQRMLKWERKFYWLDGGVAVEGGGEGDPNPGDPDPDPGDPDPQGFAGPGLYGANPLGPTEPDIPGIGGPDKGGDFGITGGGGSASPGGAGSPLVLSASGGEIKPKEEVKEEAKEPKPKKRRPTLLTAEGGLLSGSGIRRSLIAGR